MGKGFKLHQWEDLLAPKPPPAPKPESGGTAETSADKRKRRKPPGTSPRRPRLPRKLHRLHQPQKRRISYRASFQEKERLSTSGNKRLRAQSSPSRKTDAADPPAGAIPACPAPAKRAGQWKTQPPVPQRFRVKHPFLQPAFRTVQPWTVIGGRQVASSAGEVFLPVTQNIHQLQPHAVVPAPAQSCSSGCVLKPGP